MNNKKKKQTSIGGCLVDRDVKYPVQPGSISAVPLNSSSEVRLAYLTKAIGALADLLKWPVDKEWVNITAHLLDDAIPKVARRGFGKLGNLRTKYGMIKFVRTLDADGAPVYGAARTNLMPYIVRVAIDAGKRRSSLALVHELLHCADYERKKTLNHTLLHNIAAVIESDVLQKMGGYYG